MNNRKNTPGRVIQNVKVKRRKKKKSYLTKTGLKLKAEGASKEILKNHTKNRYIPENIEIVKQIKHAY